MPWYEQYFTEDYWAYADAEYDDDRTDAEVGYLAGILTRYAPGNRVLDLGCGVGRHAIGLARRGFEVVGVDISAYALDRAATAADAAGVRLDLHRADLLGAADWGLSGRGVPAVDAAYCVQAFGWGSDADQLRMLRSVRRLLPRDGVLLLDHSNILAIARIYQPEGHAEINGASFHFVRRYDPVSGRSGGEVRIGRADGTTTSLPDNVRMYQPAEVRTLLTRAGFTITAANADFTVEAPVALTSRYVQFVATPVADAESALVGHRAPVPTDGVDLRWAPDEVEFVAEPIAAAWSRVGIDQTLPDRARRYDLADPYAGDRAAPVLAAHLSWPAGASLAPERVSAGAGVTGLLHSLAGLANGGSVLVDPVGHPHLAAAAIVAGDEVRVAVLGEPAGALDAVRRHRPTVTVLDRPALVGARWTLGDIRTLAAATYAGGGVLIVDETCGAYLPPGDSAAPLTDDVPGLVVLRSMSKGYCCGGLRVGFAIAAPDVAGAVREVLAPLAVGALSIDVSLALLARPDPLAPLRDRIAEVKPVIAALLTGAGIAVVDTDPHVPWFVLGADDATRAALDARRLVAKDVPVLRSDGTRGAMLRMSVPLSADRFAAVEAALRAPGSR